MGQGCYGCKPQEHFVYFEGIPDVWEVNHSKRDYLRTVYLFFRHNKDPNLPDRIMGMNRQAQRDVKISRSKMDFVSSMREKKRRQEYHRQFVCALVRYLWDLQYCIDVGTTSEICKVLAINPEAIEVTKFRRSREFERPCYEKWLGELQRVLPNSLVILY